MFQKIEKESNSKTSRGNVPEALRQQAEQKSGLSLQDVRVHYNSLEPNRFQAFGYALGEDIYLAPGRERDLPHELWHVVQQKQGRVRPMQKLEGQNLNTDVRLEREADCWQSMGSLRYSKCQETSCIQRIVLIGDVDNEEEATSDKFIIKLAEYCPLTDDESIERIKRILRDFLKMSKKTKTLITGQGDIHLQAVYSFDSYDDLINKLMMKHEKGKIKLNVANVGQGDSSMLQLPDNTVTIDLGEKNTAVRAYCCKKRSPYEAFEGNSWEYYNNKMSELYNIYCILLRVIYRNSAFFIDPPVTEENNKKIECELARDIYFKWSDSIYKKDFTAKQIEEHFWNWKPNGKDISLAEIEDFYRKQRMFCNMICEVVTAYLSLSLDQFSEGFSEDLSKDITDYHIESIDCINRISSYLNDESILNQTIDTVELTFSPQTPLELAYIKTYPDCEMEDEKLDIDASTYSKIIYTNTLFKALHEQRLKGDFKIPQCYDLDCDEPNRGAYFLKEVIEREPVEDSKTYDIVRSIAFSFKNSFNELFNEICIITGDSRVAEFIRRHKWELVIYHSGNKDNSWEDLPLPDPSRMEKTKFYKYKKVNMKKPFKDQLLLMENPPILKQCGINRPLPDPLCMEKTSLYKDEELEIFREDGSMEVISDPSKSSNPDQDEECEELQLREPNSEDIANIEKLFNQIQNELELTPLKVCYDESIIQESNVIITHGHTDHGADVCTQQHKVMGLEDLTHKQAFCNALFRKLGLNIVKGSLDLPKKNEGNSDKNYDSLMLYYDKGDCRIFFLGDSPLENLQSVVFPEQKKYHVLIFPHHGSVTANTEDMPVELFGLEKTFGIVSAGAGNKHGLPSNPNLSMGKYYDDDGTELRGLPIPDGKRISVMDFLQKEEMNENPGMQGDIIVRSTMNMGFWKDNDESSRAPGYVVVDISDDGKKAVFYTKLWTLKDSSPIYSKDRHQQATNMAVATADRRHEKMVGNKNNKELINYMIQERILQMFWNGQNLTRAQIAEKIGEFEVNGSIVKPKKSKVDYNINMLLEYGQLRVIDIE